VAEGVQDRELKKATRLQHRCCFHVAPRQVCDVYHRHESSCKSNAGSEWHSRCAGDEVGAAKPLGRLGVAYAENEGRRNVDGYAFRPEPHKFAGVRPFTATDVAPREPASWRQDVKKGRGFGLSRQMS